MSKIALSYKIIKNDTIKLSSDGLSPVDTDIHIQENLLYDSEHSSISDLEEKNDQIEEYDIDIIKAEIKKELKQQIEQEVKQEIKQEIENQRIDILNKANLEAEKNKEQVFKDAHENGYKQGYNEGYTNGKSDAEELKNNALELFKESEKIIEKYYKDNENRMIEFSINIAKSILNNAIENSTENIMLLIKPILKQYGKKENLIITCHPENINFVRANINEIEKICPDVNIVILEDTLIEKNGCIIENEYQIIDLQLKNQLKKVKEVIEIQE